MYINQNNEVDVKHVSELKEKGWEIVLNEFTGDLVGGQAIKDGITLDIAKGIFEPSLHDKLKEHSGYNFQFDTIDVRSEESLLELHQMGYVVASSEDESGEEINYRALVGFNSSGDYSGSEAEAKYNLRNPKYEAITKPIIRDEVLAKKLCKTTKQKKEKDAQKFSEVNVGDCLVNVSGKYGDMSIYVAYVDRENMEYVGGKSDGENLFVVVPSFWDGKLTSCAVRGYYRGDEIGNISKSGRRLDCNDNLAEIVEEPYVNPEDKVIKYNDLRVGTKIKSLSKPKWGSGEIKKIDPEKAIFVVEFDNLATKKKFSERDIKFLLLTKD